MAIQDHSPDKQAVTQLLLAVQRGDKDAENRIVPLVYEEMRNIARHKLRHERKDHTLDTTALVHEAYMRLVQQDNMEWQSRTHFLAIAAQAMRRILVNYAEKRNAVKRGGGVTRVELDEIPDDDAIISDQMAEQIIPLNNALKKMETFNERGSRVIEYHFFGGLTWNEISEVLGVSTATVRRTWYVSKLWLNRELGDSAPTAHIHSEPR